MRRRPLPQRQSLRDKLTENKRSLEIWSAFSGKPIPEGLVREIKPKRAYTKRADGSEHEEQCAVIQWWNAACVTYNLPPFALFAVPNGAHLASGYIGAGKLKREGLRPGIFDLILAAPRDQFHGWFGEMKYGNNKPSDDQLKVKAYLDSAGYFTGVYWTAESAIKSLKDYLA